ncbi:hypothetical protein [Actinokineospora spheciospongiae]|uniref:hypothetical protein n=1 Tax=Actinokineospora spheciospongiae TaxID=909613 RepID=UPI000D717E3E|nr:hypothetical protein [Actinokineospora spheciospongiae]PWW50273.1 hypothetical protein DFQ13_12335 [Actinokineospora spheciospongiae]
MDDIAALLVAIGGLLTAGASAFVLVWTTVRTSRREREQAAPTVVRDLVDAAADGQLDPEELEAIARKLRDQQGGPPP